MRHTPKLIYADDTILVLDKPAGMPSASLKKDEAGTLAAWILREFPEQARLDGGTLEAGLVHRLDNDTSGVIVAARTGAALDHMRRQFDECAVTKEYAALVLGTPPDGGKIGDPIAHHPRKKKKMIVCKSIVESKTLKARPALTEFTLKGRFVSTDTSSHQSHFALLSVTILTGVRHQIRAHLASIGHPIAGDKLYQNSKIRKDDMPGLKRHFLHAERISFVHPTTGAEVEYVAELPAELSFMLSSLKTL